MLYVRLVILSQPVGRNMCFHQAIQDDSRYWTDSGLRPDGRAKLLISDLGLTQLVSNLPVISWDYK